ncbi:hypothetical protein AAVH_38372 [Aphelenchoides avenae]|nr:hypothetical protein AAVH_38372 [Aphelenchus avenae]
MPVVTKFVCPKCTLEEKGQCGFAEELPKECLDVDNGEMLEEQRKELLYLMVSSVKDTIQQLLDEQVAELACADPDCQRLGVDEGAGFCSYECIEANMNLVVSKLNVMKEKAMTQDALLEASQTVEKLKADEEIAQKALHEVVHFRQAIREFLPLINDIFPDESLPVPVRERRARKEATIATPVCDHCMGFSQKNGQIIPCSKTKADCNAQLHMMQNALKVESKVCGYPEYFDKHFMRSSDPFPDKDVLLQGDLCLLSRKDCVNLLSIHELNWMRAVNILEELKSRRKVLEERLREGRAVVDPFSIFMDAVNQLHADTSARMTVIKDPAGDTIEPMEMDDGAF